MATKPKTGPLIAGPHTLVPQHIKLSDAEAKKLMDTYRISIKDLPKIILSDPAIADLGPRAGDVIKIIRKSKTAGETVYYRGVING